MKLNTVKTYHPNSNLHEMYTTNIHNQKHGTYYQYWYSNGQLHAQSEYLNGKRHGTYKDWHTNGQLYEQSEYINHYYHGTRQRWHENGQLREQSEWVNGNLHGIRYAWNSNGSLICIQQFDTDNILVHVNYENNPIVIHISSEANIESTTLLTHLISQLTSEGKNYEIKHR